MSLMRMQGPGDVGAPPVMVHSFEGGTNMGKGICSVDWCARPVDGLGLCSMHYQRHKRGGDMDAPPETKRPGARCSVEGCERKHLAKGLCNAHLKRVRAGQPVSIPVQVKFRGSPEDRIRSRVDASGGPAACWPYLGATQNGYGRFRTAGVTRQAHRVMYESVHGPVDAALHLDHLCRNRRCCNPAHLEPVTPAENVRRGARANPDLTAWSA